MLGDRMLEREAEGALHRWIDRDSRKPLIIRGARQTGHGGGEKDRLQRPAPWRPQLQGRERAEAL